MTSHSRQVRSERGPAPPAGMHQRPGGSASRLATALTRILGALGALMIVLMLVAQYGRNVAQGYENQRLQAEISRLQRENADLRQQLVEARSLTAIERRARQMGLREEGAPRVLVVREIQRAETAPTLTDQEQWRIFTSHMLTELADTLRQMPLWEMLPDSVIGVMP